MRQILETLERWPLKNLPVDWMWGKSGRNQRQFITEGLYNGSIKRNKGETELEHRRKIMNSILDKLNLSCQLEFWRQIKGIVQILHE